MSTERKVDIVMNLMYNLPLAVIFSVIAETMNMGGVTWPMVLIDTIVSYILEMIIALWFPYHKWGIKAAVSHAEPGSRKFHVILSGVTATPFAITMSLAMSFIGSILMAHMPVFIWLISFLKVVFIFIAIAWACAYFVLPIFMNLAKKIVGVPAQQ